MTSQTRDSLTSTFVEIHKYSLDKNRLIEIMLLELSESLSHLKLFNGDGKPVNKTILNRNDRYLQLLVTDIEDNDIVDVIV